MSESGNVPNGGQVSGAEPEQVPQADSRPAYTFLDEVDDEEELLMPGPQDAWNEATVRGQGAPMPAPHAAPVPPSAQIPHAAQPMQAAHFQGGVPGQEMYLQQPVLAEPSGLAAHAAQVPSPGQMIDPLTDPLPQLFNEPLTGPHADPVPYAVEPVAPVAPVVPVVPEPTPTGDVAYAQEHAGAPAPSWPPVAPPVLHAEAIPDVLNGVPAEAMAQAPVQAQPEFQPDVQPDAQAAYAAEAQPGVEQAQASGPGVAEQQAQRRPLHAGPPIPDPSLMTGQVPVRSLADRGPSGANSGLPSGTPPHGIPVPVVPVPAGATNGAPEYLDQTAAAEPAHAQVQVQVQVQDHAQALVDPTQAQAGAPIAVATAMPTPIVPPQMPSPESTLGGNAASAQQHAEAVAAPVAPEAPVVHQPEQPEQVEQPAQVPARDEPTAMPVAEAPVAEAVIPAQGARVDGPQSRIASFIAPPSGAPVEVPAVPVEPEVTAQGTGVLTVDPEPVAVQPDATSEAPAETQPQAAVAEQANEHVNEIVNQNDVPTESPAVENVVEPAVETVAETPVESAAAVEAPVGAPIVIEPAAAEAPADAAQPEAVTAPEQPAEAKPEPAEDATPEPDTQAAAEQAAQPEQPVEAAQPAAAPEPDAVTVAADAETQPEAQQPVAAVEADAKPEAVEDAEDADEAEDEEVDGEAAPAYNEDMREAVHRVMRERRDIRNGFRTDPIPHEVLIRVLEAAHTAPSVGYSQPWDFVVIRSAKTRARMHELAERQRDVYADSLPKSRAKQFKELKIEAIRETPVNIVVTADRTRGGRHTLGRHTQPQMAPYSAALAVENLWLAARAEGLGVGWVSFFDEEELVRELGLPDHLEVVAYLCVGYVNEFPDEPELAQAGWAKKRPLSWVVHEETYGRRALPGEEPHSVLQETLRGIRPLDAKALGEAWDRQKRMTKPAGSLGMLEIISAQLCGLSRKCPPPIPEPACVAVFAGDHGVHAQGVTPWPQEVTAQMVGNFLAGGAVVNAFATQLGAEVCVVDVGVASELPPAIESGRTTGLLPRKVRPGTADMTQGPAMSREEAMRALEVGIETARDLVAAGNKALVTGDMGIANTTAAAALICVFTGEDPAVVTGRGTGIDDETHARKVAVIRQALELHRPDPADPIGVLAAVGGLEHAAIAGFLLGAASLRTPVILDGVIAGSAALVAKAIAPEVLAACIAGHRSAEPGHKAALAKLGLRPLIDLDLRLGEGTGALLALPLVQSAARAMHDVATFDSAGVTEKH
ncbi:nicotinate-nucleotide--dimethylbenzimidazole phosphoribosyltransferase [Streptacidiphilus fuscans]|uniref:Nicotinate-nucleotide--dimethylbenzimidazole phosphoribosyltransferase n=1 Tax=Streptacidiphilus fuscans TaxID=2789292 RepID=A0A931AZY6_9ACTN|nr:nicotinate-nucleotide--dimethylbenzimidazole phosphoribosyltransferase [Streptacidiphilus fuscans]MBF9068620.1 nicotinate-nucleotide--dimethylbenzimidazole phosphoribosyltransferase [Streptacidiphilus fuscans]